MEKVIDITAKRDGFRRAGLVHSETTTTYPLSDFTKEQLKQLQNEPMLVVAIRNATDEQTGSAEDSPLVLDLRKQLATLTEKLDEANGFLTSERQKTSELTTELEDERKKATDALELFNNSEEVRAEAMKSLEVERQKVTDLTAQLEAATKKGK